MRLGGCVCVVEDDEDGADAGGGKEDGCVLFAVACHDSDSVANTDAHVEHGAGQQPAVMVELVVCPSCACPGDDDCFLTAMMKTLKLEQLSQSEIDEGRVGRAVKERESLGLGKHKVILNPPLWLRRRLSGHCVWCLCCSKDRDSRDNHSVGWNLGMMTQLVPMLWKNETKYSRVSRRTIIQMEEERNSDQGLNRTAQRREMVQR